MSEPVSASGLRVVDLEVERVGSPVVRGVSLEVPPGEITVLLGTNGAGKTTLLEAISGIIPSSGGSIHLGGQDITKMPRDRRARAGLAHVEQGRATFTDLTVEENMLVAGPRSSIEAGFELFPELQSRRGAKAALLSGGEQQMLVISRALVSRPRILMLDEMSLGLAPLVIKRLIPVVQSLADQGVGVLLVEQFAPLALSVGNRAYVMSRGELAYSGSCDVLARSPEQVRDLYLGEATSA